MSTMRSLALLALAGMALSACGKKDTAEPAFVAKAERGGGGTPAAAPEAKDEFNVGDAETGFNLILELDPESKSDQVKEDRIVSSKKILSEETVTVSDPALQHLWVRIQVQPTQNYTKRVAVLRGVLERDGQPIASFQTVLGKTALQPAMLGDTHSPKEFRVDVLGGLASRPATTLLLAKTEVLLAPKGADEAVVDPATLKADPGDVSAKISNPVRVNFAAAPAAPAPADAAAAPAPPVSPAPAQ